MGDQLNILMISSENDGLEDAKVGGIGDVVRDAPQALAKIIDPDCRISIVIPSYGFLHKTSGSEKICSYDFPFAGIKEEIELYDVPGKKANNKIRHLVLHHPEFESLDITTKKYRIYCNDSLDRPFATDAIKYARFCAAAAEGLKMKIFGPVNTLHLHDWHAAFLLILIRFDRRFQEVGQIRTVFTIHNLALQGIRPFRNDPSSLEAWYPQIIYDEKALADPEYVDCLNPMAIGILFSDAVHVVSPSYAEEILKPSKPRRNDPECFIYGGEGLENDLKIAKNENRLFGILNGCDYDENRRLLEKSLKSYRSLLKLLQRTVFSWGESGLSSYHLLALVRIKRLLRKASERRPTVLLTSVTRVVDQKVRLMLRQQDKEENGKKPAIEKILSALDADTVYILLGTGDIKYEKRLLDLSYRFSNFVFMKGYDETCATALYENGDLFLMPSSYEPCGISQMLAMRSGQPCIVHAVGGLKDTVRNNFDGFSFDGEDLSQQEDSFVSTTLDSINMISSDPEGYREIRNAAFNRQFLWKDSARKYVDELYRSE
jgi:starch synthase